MFLRVVSNLKSFPKGFLPCFSQYLNMVQKVYHTLIVRLSYPHQKCSSQKKGEFTNQTCLRSSSWRQHSWQYHPFLQNRLVAHRRLVRPGSRTEVIQQAAHLQQIAVSSRIRIQKIMKILTVMTQGFGNEFGFQATKGAA